MDLNVRISKDLTIDKEHLAFIEKEKNHWRNILIRVINIIHYLSKNNDAFRGPSDVLFTKSNGHFLGAIEMLNKFNPVFIEHLKRIKNDETHVHYLGHENQKELISSMAAEIRKTIINNIKNSKYFLS
jgi:hypothetical protein|uniref:Uncharacterized protein n=1 Tax=Sipha flava TaxID=143950 RepID=A0A2S2Q9K1_9HEMI